MDRSKVKAAVLLGPKSLEIQSVELSVPLPDELRIEIRSTTLCGSDLHYYNHYRNGDIIVKSPLALGHESSGIVKLVGSEAAEKGWKIGDRVALEVGIPCGNCAWCLEGRYNICPKIRFRSSAKSDPHYWGTLQEQINHPAKWCHRLPDNISYSQAALVEPLSVALHATRRTQRNGSLYPGANVLVIGAGAIGLLVAAVASLAGASKVCVTDVLLERVNFAIANGWATNGYVAPPSLTTGLEIATDLKTKLNISNGYDVVYDCTGMEICVQTGIYAARSGGALMLIGMGNPIMTLPISAAALREVDILGGFRYANTYQLAVELLASGKLQNIERLVTHSFKGMERIEAAFRIAAQKMDEDGQLIVKVEIEMRSD
ncbi:chaperonin 10-like protein [Pyronema omphalodes]|nr:chaperonin 10-like protein [Pyronema omphalodes]